MPDFFDNKNYNDYFEKLNKRLETGGQKSVAPVRSNPTRTKRKKGIYKTIRIRRVTCLLLALALLVGVVAGITAAVSSSDKKGGSVAENSQDAESAANTVSVVEEEPPKIEFTAGEETADIPNTCLAENALVVRLSDNQIIAQRDAHTRISPASTMKIMTLLVAVENLQSLDDTFTMTYKITDPLFRADASVAGFLNNEVITMTDLLYGLILPSGGDAAMGLAVKIAGSEEAFVELMNQKAEELGLEDTHFTNVVGLYDEQNYSSAYDIAVILKVALENEICREVLSTRTYTTSSTTQHPSGIKLISTLLSRVGDGQTENAIIYGGKTGFVNEAGHCIASFGKNIDETEEYIVVTMGNKTRSESVSQQFSLYNDFVEQSVAQQQINSSEIGEQ